MSLATKGLGGSVHSLATRGYGPYLTITITDRSGRGGYNVTGQKIWISKKVYEPYIRWIEGQGEEPPEKIEIVIDGFPYGLEIGRAPSGKKAVESLPKTELEKKIKAAQKELATTRKAATKALITRAKKEIAAAKAFQAMIVNDDEEFIELLILSEM